MTDAAGTPRRTGSGPGRLLLRALAAVLLLGLAAVLVGPERLLAQLRASDPVWFGLAVLCGTLSNLVSAWRWAGLASGLGLRAPLPPLALAYFQGITVNVFLPGATVGGDTLRSVRLARLGNPFGPSAVSVLLDRVSGLWVLCVMSLLATAGVMVWGAAGHDGASAAVTALGAGVGRWPILLYAAGLTLVLGLPLMPWRSAAESGSSTLARVHRALASSRGALLRSLPASVLVQLISAGTLWLAARAVGADVGILALLAIAAPIFVAAALPISLGGFGPREFIAGMAFPLIGASAEAGVAAAVLYGLTAVLQGVLAAPLLALAPDRSSQ